MTQNEILAVIQVELKKHGAFEIKTGKLGEKAIFTVTHDRHSFFFEAHGMWEYRFVEFARMIAECLAMHRACMEVRTGQCNLEKS